MLDTQHQDSIRRSVSKRVKSARKLHGWSQAELARRSGVSLTTVNRLEEGNVSIGFDRLSAIALVLGLKLQLCEDLPDQTEHSIEKQILALLRVRSQAQKETILNLLLLN